LAVVPDVAVIAAVNGLPGAVPGRRGQLRTLVTAASFNWAVLTALRCAADTGAARVVRLDTAEHPPATIPVMLAQLGSADVVVTDLTFDATTMRPGSADDYHNHFVMPAVHAGASAGTLALSGASGFMAFTAAALSAVLAPVERAFAATAADDGFGGQPVFWGVDAALAIVAARIGLRVQVGHVAATELRDRSAGVCAAQLTDTLRLIRALDRTHP
jgi:hypothetical protein